MMTEDERREHRRQVLAQHEAKRKAAWERYYEGLPAMDRALLDPERGDVRLAFEAGWDARDSQRDDPRPTKPSS